MTTAKKPDFVVLYANEVYKKQTGNSPPENFQWYYTERHPENNQPVEYFIMRGVVIPLITKGINKGQPNSKKPERETEVRIKFTAQSVRDWVAKSHPEHVSSVTTSKPHTLKTKSSTP